MTRKLIIEISTDEDELEACNVNTKYIVEPEPVRGETSAIVVIASRLFPLTQALLEGTLVAQTFDEMKEPAVPEKSNITIQ